MISSGFFILIIIKIQKLKGESQNYHRQSVIPPSFKNKLLWRDNSKVKSNINFDFLPSLLNFDF
ncbi:MAG: hypothetical protein A2731_01470 [Candidatus Buchananbacteria bacterium RIFCSPHIGHO2_01_FULL_39_8]|uniref:Uncharacterized protein n=1 Tax=Candidatus Buchananbacteria bacterium RIFCSPHIGHO2_01_FULL_39_8 TaxID=1797533 RepID=A0A1G1Y018_9BACT|nr:MAG: hypothetical protein A2731_01470 [Candidatus Buchananbacteria bacterium RIFCSPHIGHO2_01_FULL_39_8]